MKKHEIMIKKGKKKRKRRPWELPTRNKTSYIVSKWALSLNIKQGMMLWSLEYIAVI